MCDLGAEDVSKSCVIGQVGGDPGEPGQPPARRLCRSTSPSTYCARINLHGSMGAKNIRASSRQVAHAFSAFWVLHETWIGPLCLKYVPFFVRRLKIDLEDCRLYPRCKNPWLTLLTLSYLTNDM
jgi:hypothetical protein